MIDKIKVKKKAYKVKLKKEKFKNQNQKASRKPSPPPPPKKKIQLNAYAKKEVSLGKKLPRIEESKISKIPEKNKNKKTEKQKASCTVSIQSTAPAQKLGPEKDVSGFTFYPQIWSYIDNFEKLNIFIIFAQ